MPSSTPVHDRSVEPPEDEEYAISVVSLAELHFGVLKASGTPALASRLQRLSEVEHAFDAIPVDERIARAYAECAQAVLKVGRSLGHASST